ncbi:MAG: PHP domain-containing protein [Chloroflexi bacterium]|nr:PHP domain-containing protein [Chloroflexota bacterium]
MPTRLDMHTHTVLASPDSELTPAALVKTARKVRLEAAAITEHNRTWELRDTMAYSQELDFYFLRGMEVNTDLGHILVFGLNTYMGGIHICKDLRKTVKAAGGFMIVAHPFRQLFHGEVRWGGKHVQKIPTVEEASSMPVFDLVDDIEVLNGGTGELENFFAMQVAKYLGMRGTGGSDAHSTHGLGRTITVFEKEIRETDQLIAELRAGRYYPAEVSFESEEKELIPYIDGVVEADLDFRLRQTITEYQ